MIFSEENTSKKGKDLKKKTEKIIEKFLSLETVLSTLTSRFLGNPDIDKAIKLGLAHPMGPLLLADLIGIDTIIHILEYLYSELKKKQYQPCHILKEMYKQGKLGKKTGEGFYKY